MRNRLHDLIGIPRRPRLGQVIPLIAALSVLLVSMAAMAVDLIYAYAVKAKLVTSVDAAALAAARALSEGETQAEQQAAVNLMVQQLFDANFPSDFMLTHSRNHSTPVITDNGDGTRTVLVSATVTVPTYFLRFAGYNDLPISASATALRRDVNLMLVLDRSGSMSGSPGSNPGPTAFDDLQFASGQFVDHFDATRDKLGLVSFGTATWLDRAPATAFKPDLVNLINQLISVNSGTNSSDGLWLAYNALTTLNDPDPLNVIVFFTDGAATTFSGTFDVTASTCAGQQKVGTAWGFTNSTSMTSMGLTEVNAGPAPFSGDEQDFVPGCGFSWGNDLSNRVPALPLMNLHGVSVQGSRTIPSWLGGFPRTRGDVIRAISANTTMNTATLARQDPNIPMKIFAIGLGGTAAPPAIPLDQDLLLRVANDPASPVYDTNEPVGRTIITPNASELEAAFEQVASDIFRLIQ